MPGVATYDPNRISVIVGGKLLSGFAPDAMVTASRANDMWSYVTGLDGIGTRVKSNDYSGTVTITLQATAPSNSILQAFATLDEQNGGGSVPLLIRDNQGSSLITAVTVWVQKIPDVEYTKSNGTRAWTLMSDNLQISISGNT